MGDTNWLHAEHRRRNLQTRDRWQAFAPHRARVTELVSRLGTAPSHRLLILGAGNCNDIELPRLLDTFAELHLADLDETALNHGVDRQGMSTHASVVLHAGWDATGQFGQLAQWRSSPTRPLAEYREFLGQLESSTPAVAGAPFDAVVSLCLLSQLIDSVSLALGPASAWADGFALAIRDQHLRTLEALRGPRGRVLLVTDFLSSDTCPQLLTVSDSGLADLAQTRLQAGDFFTGTNPFAIRQRIKESRPADRGIRPIEIARPWRWRLGERAYAVTAIAF